MERTKVARNDKEYAEIYDYLYDYYRQSEDDDIINLWLIHQRNHSLKDDFDSIGCRVCEDMLRQRGNSYIDDTYLND